MTKPKSKAVGGVAEPAWSKLCEGDDEIAAAKAHWQRIPGFASGGFTGGRRGMVAGVVHGEEFVFDADATARIGIGNLEALRAGKMTNAIPTMPSVLSAERALTAPSSVRVEQHLHFDLSGAVMTADILAQINAKTDEAKVVGAMGGAQLGQAQMEQRARRTIPGRR